MNNIISNFDQILGFAREYNLPLSKKKGILREYLQSRTLELIYQEKTSKYIHFVGGTALRLLHNLDRFSEDLDFDVKDRSISDINKLVEKVHHALQSENLLVDLYHNTTEKRDYYELRFSKLLYELNISENKSEKLMIKLDFDYFWKGIVKKVIMFNRYGFLINVVTLPLNQILVQKLFAYLNRKQTLPRDIYDITWLIARNITTDKSFIQKNKLVTNIAADAIKKHYREKEKIGLYKRQLKPFLINEKHVENLAFFPNLLKKILIES